MLAEQVATSLLREGIISEEENEIVRFGLKSLEGNLLSIVLTLAVGICFKRTEDALLLWLLLFPLRKNAGGYHALNQVRCFLMSFAMLVVSFAFTSVFSYAKVFCIICAGMAGLIIWVLAPVDTPSKKLDLTECKVYRTRSRMIVGMEGLVLILSLYFRWETITRSAIMTFFIVSISLLMGMIKLAVSNKLKQEKED